MPNLFWTQYARKLSIAPSEYHIKTSSACRRSCKHMCENNWNATHWLTSRITMLKHKSIFSSHWKTETIAPQLLYMKKLHQNNNLALINCILYENLHQNNNIHTARIMYWKVPSIYFHAIQDQKVLSRASSKKYTGRQIVAPHPASSMITIAVFTFW